MDNVQQILDAQQLHAAVHRMEGRVQAAHVEARRAQNTGNWHMWKHYLELARLRMVAADRLFQAEMRATHRTAAS